MATFTEIVRRAYDFHSFGFEQVQQYGDWIMGPVFIVRNVAPEEEMVFNAFSGIYKQDDSWKDKFKVLLDQAGKATQPLVLDSGKHSSSPKCTYRLLTGEPEDTKYPLELGFPLVQLAKKLGVDEWRVEPGGTNIMVCAYMDGVLQGIFSARRVVPGHVVKDGE